MSTTVPPAPPSGSSPAGPPARRRSPGAWAVLTAGAVLAAVVVGSGAEAVASRAVRSSDAGSEVLSGVRSVEVDLECGGDVTLDATAADGTARVAWEDHWSFRRPHHTRGVHDGVLRVRVECPRLTWGWGPSSALTLTVPAGVDVTVGADAGDVVARSLGGAATLSSGAGDLLVEGARGDLVLSAGVGEVRVTDTSSTRVRASSGTGDITVRTTSPPQDVRADSGVGDVLVEVPDDGGGYAVAAESGIGEVSVGVAGDARSARTITATSGVGDVTVRPAP